MIRTLALLWVTGALLTACVPGSSTVAPASTREASGLSPFRIKSLTEDLSQHQGMMKVIPFRYDNSGRYVESMRFITPDSAAWSVDRTDLHYDANERLVTLNRTVQERVSTFLPFAERYNYTYDAASRLTETKHYTAWGINKSLSLADITYWQYTDGWLTKSTVTFYDNNQPNGRITEAVYGYANGNLTTYTTTFRQPGQPDHQLRSIIQYDSQPNPYRGQPMMRFYFEAPYLIWSQNNAVDIKTEGIDGALVYSYDYNSDGLPVLRREILKGSVTQVLRYEYERL